MGKDSSGAAIVCALLLTAGANAFAGGSTTVHRIKSHAVADNIVGITSVRPLFVYTPEGYEDSRRNYPVIYWIPGWETPASSEYVGGLDAAIAKGWIPPVITVTIDVREGVLILNSPVFGNWADFLIEEVVPFIDGEYRAIRSPKGRALMGHSTGGYAAMLLPLLYPGVWSAVGLNDASVWGACATGTPKGSSATDEFSGYAGLSAAERAWTQIAIATSPNMASPRFYDAPWSEGAGPEVAAAWDSRCVSNLGMLRANSAALAQLEMIGLTLPTDGGRTNVGTNVTMVETMRHVGAEPQVLHVKGTHGSDRAERFVFLAGLVTSVMAEPSFDVAALRALTWASLRDARGTR